MTTVMVTIITMRNKTTIITVMTNTTTTTITITRRGGPVLPWSMRGRFPARARGGASHARGAPACWIDLLAQNDGGGVFGRNQAVYRRDPCPRLRPDAGPVLGGGSRHFRHGTRYCHHRCSARHARARLARARAKAWRHQQHLGQHGVDHLRHRRRHHHPAVWSVDVHGLFGPDEAVLSLPALQLFPRETISGFGAFTAQQQARRLFPWTTLKAQESRRSRLMVRTSVRCVL